MRGDWYVRTPKKIHGPLTNVELREAASSGRIGPETPIRRGPTGRWLSAKQIRGLSFGKSRGHNPAKRGALAKAGFPFRPRSWVVIGSIGSLVLLMAALIVAFELRGRDPHPNDELAGTASQAPIEGPPRKRIVATNAGRAQKAKMAKSAPAAQATPQPLVPLMKTPTTDAELLALELLASHSSTAKDALVLYDQFSVGREMSAAQKTSFLKARNAWQDRARLGTKWVTPSSLARDLAKTAPITSDYSDSEDDSVNDYSIEVRSVARVVATLTCDLSYPDERANDWVVFASQAPDLPGQFMSQSSLEPPGKPARDESELRRALLMTRVRPRAKPLSALRIRLTYKTTLRSRKLRRGTSGSKSVDLTPEERQLYLADHGFLDFKRSAVRNWIKQHGFERRENEGEIGFARRVFLGLKSSMKYDWPEHEDLHASAVCANGASDCGGLSTLFASIMRANNIPARTLWGRWAGSAKHGETMYNRPYYQQHVKAEFFARGVGWIPVDLASGILHDKSVQGLRFFGNDPGNFITFHVDDHLDLNTLLFGVKTVDDLQVLAWWLKGSGSLNNSKVDWDWQVKSTELK